MAIEYFRGQTATLEASGTNVSGDSLPTDAVAVIDEPEVGAPEQDVQELRGTGSTKRQDEMKTSTGVTVSGDVSAFDPDTWKTLIDYDTASDSLDDSSEVATFTVTVTYESDSTLKTIEVSNAYIDGSVPLGGGREEWIGMTLELVGDDLTITDTTP